MTIAGIAIQIQSIGYQQGGRAPLVSETKRTLLPQFRLSLLDRSDNHVANTSIRESVKVGAESIRLDDEEGFGSAVVSAIDNCANRETECQTEFVTGCADCKPSP